MVPNEFGMKVKPNVTNGLGLTLTNAEPPTFLNKKVLIAGKGNETSSISFDDITLRGFHTFSCNPVTDKISSFQNNFGADCMDVCYETVRALRSIDEIKVLEEDDRYWPFYISMFVLMPIVCICFVVQACYIYDGDENLVKTYSEPIMNTCKVFDLCSDWAFRLISLESSRFTETSTMGYFQDNTFKDVQKASLAFCIIGTILVIIELSCKTGGIDPAMQALITSFVVVFEDIPQLSLCGVYLSAMLDDQGFSASDDLLTTLSIVLSSISLVFNIIMIIYNCRDGGPSFSNA
jgi:hypothetical protein